MNLLKVFAKRCDCQNAQKNKNVKKDDDSESDFDRQNDEVANMGVCNHSARASRRIRIWASMVKAQPR